jgi:hypothetical protein
LPEAKSLALVESIAPLVARLIDSGIWISADARRRIPVLADGRRAALRARVLNAERAARRRVHSHALSRRAACRRVGRWRGGVLSCRPGCHVSRGFPPGAHPVTIGHSRSVSSARLIEPCMRFSRTRLTDIVHRRHSAFPASPCRVWGQQRFRPD